MESKKWFGELTGCLECGSTERKHQGYGLCVNCYARKRRKENIESARAYNKEYESRPEIKAKRKAYNQTEHRKETVNVSARKFRARNKDICYERTQEWREENPDKLKEYRDNPFVKKRRNFTYVIRKYGVIALDVLERDNYRCQRCGKEDPNLHHIDWDKKNNTMENLIVFCNSCHKTLHSWVPPRLRRMIFEEWMKLPLKETAVNIKEG